MDRPPLIAHLVHHFGTGGMENGMVNLLDHLPARRYRHAIVCMDGYTDFRGRLRRNDVDFYALGKKPGKDPGAYLRLWRLLRALRPAIVHSRNLATLEGQFVAAAVGVPGRIHGEHGRDVFDLHGTNARYNRLRRLARPLVHRYVAVSRDLERWLLDTVGARRERVTQIYNGVDRRRFLPRSGARDLGPAGFAGEDSIVIGSVGRMAGVKNHRLLVHAFVALLAERPELARRARLVIVGDGVERQPCLDMLASAGLSACAWLPGERDDVHALLRGFDLFVLPSLGEGISNTILEAMASGLPVIATAVGGNPELVAEGTTGRLVPSDDAAALARAIADYVDNPALLGAQGRAARRRIEDGYSIESMAAAYLAVYDDVARERGIRVHAEAAPQGDCRVAGEGS